MSTDRPRRRLSLTQMSTETTATTGRDLAEQKYSKDAPDRRDADQKYSDNDLAGVSDDELAAWIAVAVVAPRSAGDPVNTAGHRPRQRGPPLDASLVRGSRAMRLCTFARVYGMCYSNGAGGRGNVRTGT